jgi:hypothetical protein
MGRIPTKVRSQRRVKNKERKKGKMRWGLKLNDSGTENLKKNKAYGR